MARPFPELRWTIESADHISGNAEAQRFRCIRDHDLAPLTDNPSLWQITNSHLPHLQDHAHFLHHTWMKKLPEYDPDYDLDVLIRLVGPNLFGTLPEVNGVHGIFKGDEHPCLMLLCATTDMKVLTSRFTHEFAHYLAFVTAQATPGLGMAGWLRSETMAEQLVMEMHGIHHLSHNRICPPSSRTQILRLLAREQAYEDAELIEAVNSFVTTRITGLDAYALVYEILHARPWSFHDLLSMSDETFRQSLLQLPVLWREEPMRLSLL